MGRDRGGDEGDEEEEEEEDEEDEDKDQKEENEKDEEQDEEETRHDTARLSLQVKRFHRSRREQDGECTHPPPPPPITPYLSLARTNKASPCAAAPG